MKTSFVNKFNMYNRVKDLCEANPTVIALIPTFVAWFNQFVELILHIHNFKIKQDEDIKGFAISKEAKRNLLIERAFFISKHVVAYATSINDILLCEQLDFAKSDYSRSNDLDLADRGSLVFSKGTELIADLGPFGITQTLLDDLHTAHEDFYASLNDPRNAVVEKKYATREINELFSQADSILKTKLDKLIVTIESSHATFYNNYKDARIIVDSGHREITLEGRVFDAVTLSPVRGVTVECLEDNKHYVTGAKGNYRFMSQQSGNYTIFAARDLYKTQTIHNIVIVEGSTNHRDIYIERGVQNYDILPNNGIIAWHGSPDNNILITIENRGLNACLLWAYITLHPGDSIPPDKQVIQPQGHYQFRLADFMPAETIYLHLYNPDQFETATYLLLFQNEVQ